MKWTLLAISCALILAGGLVTDSFFRPAKDDNRNKNNPTTYTGIMLCLDGVLVFGFALAEYGKK